MGGRDGGLDGILLFTILDMILFIVYVLGEHEAIIDLFYEDALSVSVLLIEQKKIVFIDAFHNPTLAFVISLQYFDSGIDGDELIESVLLLHELVH